MDRQSVRIYHIRITLDETEPPIWRLIAVPSEFTLGDLHLLIQIAMGWEDDHLHQFTQRLKGKKPTAEEQEKHFSRPRDPNAHREFYDRLRGWRSFVPTCDPMGGPINMEGEDEDAFTLADVLPKPRSKLHYEYDFGDGWRHTIELQAIADPEPGKVYPVCLDGKRACPPEDCGGVWGYEKIVQRIRAAQAKTDDSSREEGEAPAAAADPTVAEYDEWIDVCFSEYDPEAFDLEAVNAEFARLETTEE